MSEELRGELRDTAAEVLPPDFTGSIASPVTISERGKPVRHIREYVNGECTASYDVRIRKPRR